MTRGVPEQNAGPSVDDHAPARVDTVAPSPPPRIAEHDLTCPLCDYNLTGLETPRCPECGHQFDWDGLRARQQLHRKWLFEYQRSSLLANFASFFRTLGASMVPGRFWREVTPTQQPRCTRLVLYALLVCALGVFLLSPITVMPIPVIILDFWVQSVRIEGIARQTLLTLCIPPDRGHVFIPLVLMCTTWPWLTFAVLLLYRTTMRQAKVKLAHVLRCAIYSADGFLVLAVLVPAVMWPTFAAWRTVDHYLLGMAGIFVCEVFLTYRLGRAYASYLRFPHSWPAAIASQCIVFLLYALAIVA